MTLEGFKKLPLGGVDRRAMVGALAERGPIVAREALAADRAKARPAGTAIPKDVAVIGRSYDRAVHISHAGGITGWRWKRAGPASAT